MKKISFDYLQNTAFLGGVGTGCLKLYADGGTQFAGLAKSSSRCEHPGEHASPVSFAVCVRADDQDAVRCALLKTPDGDASMDSFTPDYAPVSSFCKEFPFTCIDFDTAACGVEVSLTAFNPVIPHNSIDSGIPAAFFEIEIANRLPCAATVSFGARLASFFYAGKAAPHYDKASGAFYAELAETAGSVPARRRGSLCLATDSADFTYEVTGECPNGDFLSRFGEKSGFLTNSTAPGAEKNMTALLACHLRLAPGQREKRRFLVAWSFPYCAESPAKSGEKNYYCHYFSDIGSCVSYCFTHFERLRRESGLMRELAEHLPAPLVPLIDGAFTCVKDPAIRRDSAGVLKGIAEEETKEAASPFSFALDYLFPGITTATGVLALGGLMSAKGRFSDSDAFVPSAFDTDCTPEQICSRLRMILRLFYAYRTCSELRFYSENWVDISLMTEILCDSAARLSPAENPVNTDTAFAEVYAVLLPALFAMIEIADLLRDKKRKAFFEQLLCEHKQRFDAYAPTLCETRPFFVLSTQYASKKMCAFALYPQQLLERAAENTAIAAERCGDEPDFFACAELVLLKRPDLCEKAAETLRRHLFSCKRDLYDAAMQAGALVPAFSGFDYDKNACALSFSPEESLLDGDGVFKGFVSFDGGFGRVEQGPDYIELIVYAGEVKVRRFTSPHRPYKVLYGGRLWPCDIEGNTVTLDSNLSVTKSKKLTVLIDASK